jgi:hypothetical protein
VRWLDKPVEGFSCGDRSVETIASLRSFLQGEGQPGRILA